MIFATLVSTNASGVRPMKQDKELGRMVNEYGPEWTALYRFRSEVLRLLSRLEKDLIAIEKREYLTGNETISSQSHTIEVNRRLWDGWDWSRRGEEWTGVAKLLRGWTQMSGRRPSLTR